MWDGDQIIAEQRSSGLDVVTGGAPNFGTVRYVHLLGIDAPVAILDNRFSDARVIHYNWRGLAEASSWSNGNPADEELGAGIKVAWPAGQGVYLKKGNNPNVGQDVTWIGSLPANGQGDAGLVYRRNRYYDPASGRFTQEDPIGLAGGLNQYGFAEGDPVNFSDAFGLCAEGEGGSSGGAANDSTSEESDTTKKSRTPGECFNQSVEPVASVGKKGLAAAGALGAGLIAEGTAMVAAARANAEYMPWLMKLSEFAGDIWLKVETSLGGRAVTQRIMGRAIAGTAGVEAGMATARVGGRVLAVTGALAGAYLGTTWVACQINPEGF